MQYRADIPCPRPPYQAILSSYIMHLERPDKITRPEESAGASSVSSIVPETASFPSSEREPFSESASEYVPSLSKSSLSESTAGSLSSCLSVCAPITAILDEPAEPCTSKVTRYLDNLVSHQSTQGVPEPVLEHPDKENRYVKSAPTQERATLCPICYKDVDTHFSRHLLRHHKDHQQVQLMAKLKPKSKERRSIVTALRKQGYFHLKTEKDKLNPVKSSKDTATKYFVCVHCLGYYAKNSLYKHVKRCTRRPVDQGKPKSWLAESQSFSALVKLKNDKLLKSLRIREEVFSVMKPDEISHTAKSDPLIILYGEHLISKHKRQQIAVVVSNKIREMGRLLLALKEFNPRLESLFSYLKPNMFEFFVAATKKISGYNETNKSFQSPSLALHMGTSLKILCDVAFKIVLENRQVNHITWSNRQEKKAEIKDLKKLIESHWCSELSSLALKSLQEKQWQKPIRLPLTSDIQLFQQFLTTRASEAFTKLKEMKDHVSSYRTLTQCVLAQTVIFNRKRIGDVQYLKIDTYNSNCNTTNNESFVESLSDVEKVIYKKFKRVVTGGKGSKPVPVLFSKQMQKYIELLLTIRKETSIVPHTNPYLFANPQSKDRWMSGVNVLRNLAKDCGAKHPELLTSTKFRKHIATTLQLLNMDSDEVEQIAKFMGHTQKTHAEFYRLPQDIYQTAKVAKILLLLEKGRGKEFKGKRLEDININTDVYYSSEAEDDGTDDLPLSQRVINTISVGIDMPLNTEENLPLDITDKRTAIEQASNFDEQVADTEPILSHASWSEENLPLGVQTEMNLQTEEPSQAGIVEDNQLSERPSKKSKGVSDRKRWSEIEKKLVLKHFSNHIKRKITPKKGECTEFLKQNANVLIDKDWVRVKTFVYNSFRKN
ncbi:hypothetical protein PPYR_02097 [Photinus pyralis]|uniref:Uncharacterized protein n=2 Tax=Photinus pyralis TaxID=7054 RepID=A0A5N4B687_PHOPY|nr:hypothetical protein PPYR_02097 [Photinus pyralis]